MERMIGEMLLRVPGRSVAGYPLQWDRRHVLIICLCQHSARYWDSRILCLRKSGKESHKDSPSAET